MIAKTKRRINVNHVKQIKIGVLMGNHHAYVKKAFMKNLKMQFASVKYIYNISSM
jgi:hypothetical protein